MAISGYIFLRLCALVQEKGVSGITAWACEIKSHILNVTRRQNGYRAQAQDNQFDANDSVFVVHEPRSSDYNGKSDDIKVQAAD